MNAVERLQALLDGKKIRDVDWKEECFIYATDNKIVDASGEEYDSMFLTLTDSQKSWEIYKEPKLNLGPEHIGRTVKLRNGNYEQITGFHPSKAHPVRLGPDSYTTNGSYGDEKSEWDIIKLMPKGE